MQGKPPDARAQEQISWSASLPASTFHEVGCSLRLWLYCYSGISDTSLRPTSKLKLTIYEHGPPTQS